MPDLVRRYDNKNQPIVLPKKGLLTGTYFNLVRLRRGEEYRVSVEGIESLYAVLSGNVDIEVDGTSFRDVGGEGHRPGTDRSTRRRRRVQVRANTDDRRRWQAESATRPMRRFVCCPEGMVDVGSVETRSHRRIFHLLGQNGLAPGGNL
jgi:5-deoxy-glucuronate isomerase